MGKKDMKSDFKKTDDFYRIRAMRHNYSKTHIMSSTLFLQRCHEIEKSKKSKYPDVFFWHNAYVINSIFSTVAFLESYINEFFSNSMDVPQLLGREIPKKELSRIQAIWGLGIPRTASHPILEKYQIALILTDNEPFTNQDSMGQKIKTITKLRNELIHFEPRWIDVFEDPEQERKKMTGVGSQLQHEKFSHNPFVAKTSPFFPNRCLGYGCAKWTYENSLDFVQMFSEKMKVPFRYREDIEDELKFYSS